MTDPTQQTTPTRDEAVRELLRELHAVVIGECPSLLNEDSGGNADLALRIEDALASAPAPASGGVDAVAQRLFEARFPNDTWERQSESTKNIWRRCASRLTPAATPVCEAGGATDMRRVCEALGFDPTNHHNAAKCPYCTPALAKPASSPAGGDVVEALRVARDYVVDARNERQEEVIRVGAYPRLVKREEARLEAIEKDIREIDAALSQSTSAE